MLDYHFLCSIMVQFTTLVPLFLSIWLECLDVVQ